MKIRIKISYGLKKDPKFAFKRVEALTWEDARQIAFCFLTSLMVLHPNEDNWKIVETKEIP